LYTDITATDSCDADVTITYVQNTTAGACPDSYTLSREWTATDNCGNSVTEIQLITVEDTTPPSLSGVPASATVECGHVPEVPELYVDITATDSCDVDVLIEFEETQAGGTCAENYIITREWTATDNCGNSVTETQLITVADTNPPTLSGVPANVTVECGNIPDPPVIYTDITATDSCDTNVEITYDEATGTVTCTDGYTLERTWTATDNCGNSFSQTQIITVEDTVPPVLSGVPADETVNCNSVPSPPNTSLLTATDNCDDDVTITFEETTDAGSCADNYTLIRTWTATDNCGNQHSLSQSIYVGDTEDPVLTGIPADVTVDCDNVPLPPTNVAATDDCDTNVEIFYEEIRLDGNCPYNYVLRREWIAYDDCGGEASATQEITVIDTTGPVIFNVPVDLVVDLTNGEAIPGVPTNITATDNCDPAVTVEFEETQVGDPCNYIIYRTWTATDICGNSAQETQEINVLDNLVVTLDAEATPICMGGNTNLIITPSDPGATYVWTVSGGSVDDSGTVPVFTVSMAGTYTVAVEMTNSNGCVGTASTTVVAQDNATISATWNEPVCEDSDILLTSTGGSGTYSWTGPNGFTSSDQNPVITNSTTAMDGTYTVSFTDANNCIATGSVDVVIGESLGIDFNVNHKTCSDLGSIIIGPSGGTGNYTYDWDHVLGTDDPQNALNLQEGTYSVTVTDTGGCTVALNNVVVLDNCAGPCIADAGTMSNIDLDACLDDETAKVTGTPDENAIIPPGYVVAYVLTIGNNQFIQDTSSFPTFTVTDTGTYEIHTIVYDPATLDLDNIDFGVTTLFDLNGLFISGGGVHCGDIDLTGISMTVHLGPGSIASTTPDNCNLGVGEVVLEPINYTFEWPDAIFGNERNDLSAGTYDVTVSDDYGCTSVLSVVITNECECPDIEITTVVEEPLCGLGNGSATVLVDGDVADYFYAWSPDDGTPNATGNSRTGLQSNIYVVTVTFPFVPNCFEVDTIVIGVADGPEPDSIIITPATCSSADGSVEFFPAGFTYVWNDNSSTANPRTNMAAGEYQLFIIDPANPGCPDIIEVTVEQTNPLVADADMILLPGCTASNGEVQINVANGSGTYNYAWSDGLGANQSLRTDLPAGDYEVTVTDTDPTACEVIVSFSLTESSNNATVVIDPTSNVSCNGFTDGTLDYSITYDPSFAGLDTILISDTFDNTYTNGSLAPGYYCVTVYELGGCSAGEACGMILEPSMIDIVPVVTSGDCNNGGTIDLTVAGGAGGYIYDWNIQPIDLTDLEAGDYIVTVTDTDGCSAVAFGMEVIVDCDSIPCTAPVVNNVSTQDATCGVDNGMADITMIGNAADFTFIWPATVTNYSGGSATDLAVASYDVTVTLTADTTCSTVVPIIINNSTTEVAIINTISDATCSASDGSAEVTDTLGVSLAGATYLWSHNNSTTAMVSNLPSGNHVVTVTHSDGCITILPVTIEEINPLDGSVINIAEPMCGDSNGIATINMDGGSGFYSYDWITTPDQATRTDLYAGLWEVTVTDIATGCDTIVSFVLTNDVADANVVANDVEINCAGDGSVNANYTVTYDPGFVTPADTIITNTNGDTILNTQVEFIPDTYTINIYDANDCLAGTGNFAVTEPSALLVTTTVTPENCTDLGDIDLTVNGGTTPYSYNWSTGSTSEDTTGVAAGIYFVTVSDANGCTSDLSLTVNYECVVECVPPVVTATSTTDATCNTSNGTASITMAGDPMDYTYAWPAIAMTGDTTYATGLASGPYEVTITLISDPSCSTVETININDDVPNPPVVFTTTDATCGNADGTAEVTDALGVTLSGATYVWSAPSISTDSMATDLSTGSYSVTVTDNNGCITTINDVQIGEINTLDVNITEDVQPSCGNTDGVIYATVNNGSGNYTYEWNNVVGTDTLYNVASGSNTLLVSDLTTGCDTLVTINVTDNIAFGATIDNVVATDVSCIGDANGSVTYTVNYDAGFAMPADTILTTGVNGSLGVGTYTLSIYDANACLATSIDFDIVEPTALDISTSVVNEDCGTTGSIDLTVSGGTAPYNYLWSTATAETTEDINNLVADDYTVTVTDANGCSAVVTTTVNNDCPAACIPPVITSTSSSNSSCVVDDGTASLTVAGDPADYTYTWLPAVSDTTFATGLPAGPYSVTVSLLSDPTCNTVVDLDVNNDIAPPPVVLSTTDATCGNADGAATITAGYVSYVWSTSGSTSETATDLPAGTQSVTVTDSNGCMASIDIEIGEINTLDVTIAEDVQPSCGNTDGVIYATVNNGSGNYTYEWNNVVGTDTLYNVGSGANTLLVTDVSSGCDTLVSINVSDNLAFGATIDNVAANDISCIGDANGSVTYTVNYDAGFAMPADTILTTGINGSLGVGSYTISIYDANGCLATSTDFAIAEPTALNLTTTTVAATCTTTGSIDLTVSGGTTPYSYAWSNTATTEDINNLMANDYIVTVTDANGCIAVTTTTVDDDCLPACVTPVVANVVVEDANCLDDNGSITITMLDDSADYNYSWSPNTSDTTTVALDLTAGTYYVTISQTADASCFVIDTINLNNIPEGVVPVVIATTDASCAGTDGTAEVTGGFATYAWSDPSMSTSETASDLPAGPFSVTITDTNGCITILNDTIDSNNPLTWDVVIDSPADCGASNGCATVNVSNGSGNYTYTWLHDAGTGQSRCDLAAGYYQVWVVDQTGCEITATFTMDENAVAANIVLNSPTQISCIGNCDATIDYTITYPPGFVGPQDVVIVTTIPTPGDTVVNGTLCPGSYIILVSDGNGCAAGSMIVDVTAPTAIDVSYAAVDETCDDLGSIDLTVSGGTASYIYNWNIGSSTEDLTNVTAGSYAVTVTDANACTAVITDIAIVDDCIVLPPCDEPVIVNTVVEDADCGLDNGSATITMSDNGDYTYLWSTPLGTDTTFVNDLGAGTYYVTVSYANDAACFVIDTIHVNNVPSGIVPVEIDTFAASCTGADGIAIVTGGFANYEWSSPSASTDSIATDLPAGPYAVTVTDATGCITIISGIIGTNNPLTLDVTIDALADCNVSNGAATINVFNGSGNYTYNWINDGGTGQSRTDLAAMSHEVLVTDLVTGCQQTISFMINENVPAATILVNGNTSVSCFGDTTGLVDYTITYDAGFVSPADTVIVTVPAGDTVVNGTLAAGDYQILISDGNGCAAGHVPFSVTGPTALDVSYAVTDETCDDSGIIDLTINGGTGPYTFVWSNGANSEDLAGIDAGTFAVTITDANSCVTIIENIIVEDDCIVIPPCVEPVITNVVVEDATCGDDNGSIIITANGTDYVYSWSAPVSVTNTTNIATDLAAGTYYVTVSQPLDPECNVVDTIIVDNILEGSVPVIMSSTNASCDAADGTADVTPDFASYLWSHDGSTTASVTDLPSGTHTVEVTDANDCLVTLTVIIGEDNPLFVDVTVDVDPTCGLADGVATATVTGGSGDYTYLWDSIPGAATQTGLAAGLHGLIVIDNVSDCERTTAFSLVNNGPGATIAINGNTTISCAGDADATVDFNVVYDAGFAFPADTTVVMGADTVQNGSLGIGGYVLWITDANGCEVGSIPFEVTGPTTLDVSYAALDKTCADFGSIELTVSGGTAPYTYLWSPLATTEDLTNLDAGTFSVTVTDANGCTATIENITITDDCTDPTPCTNPVVSSIVTTEATCAAADGSAAIYMQGDPSLYNYVWTDNVSDTTVATGLTAGIYYVTISDASNVACSIIDTIIIESADSLNVGITTTSASCGAADGTATVDAGYTYLWDHDGSTGATVSNLPAGPYMVMVTDVNGCVEILTGHIDSDNPMGVTVNIDIEPTCGNGDGQVTAIVTGGSDNYNYYWNGVLGPAASTGFTAGSYDLLVVDNVSGCVDSLSFVMDNDIAGAVLTVNADVEVACVGEDDGMVDFTVVYEAGFAGPADTVIVNAQDSIVTNGNLAAGEYTILITDANGCAAGNAMFEVTEPTALNVNLAVLAETCTDEGAIDLTVTGGTSPYVYNWNTGATSEDLTNLDPDSYSVTVTDANECSIAVDDIIVADSCSADDCLGGFLAIATDTIMTMNCGGTIPYCVEIELEDILNYYITDNGDEFTGDIWGCNFDSVVTYSAFTIPSQGTFGPYNLNSWTINGVSYSGAFDTTNDLVDSMNVWDTNSNWNLDPATFIISGGNPVNVYSNMQITQVLTGAFSVLDVNTNLVPNSTSFALTVGGHELTFTNTITGCSDTINVDVFCITPEVIIDTIYVQETDTICITSDELPGTVMDIFNDCEGSAGDFVVFDLLEGVFCVTCEGFEVGTDSACITLCDDYGFCDTTYMFITVIEQDSFPGDIPPDADQDSTSTNGGDGVVINVLENDTLNGVFDTLYVLDPPFDGEVLVNDDGTISYDPNDAYCDDEVPDYFTYVVCNDYACDTTTVTVYVLCNDLIVFTGFSPNGDGVNDFFHIDGIENYPDSELSVFNRWGNEVFFNKGYLNDWDGTWQGKILPDGTYFYVLEDGEGNSYSGYVQIHR